MGEIVGNDLHMFFERVDELVEAIQAAAFDFVDPTLNRKNMGAGYMPGSLATSLVKFDTWTRLAK
jgi:hypothetical protein